MSISDFWSFIVNDTDFKQVSLVSSVASFLINARTPRLESSICGGAAAARRGFLMDVLR